MQTEATLLAGLGENPILRRELRRLKRDRRELMVLAVFWALMGCGVLAAFVFPQVLVGLLGAASAGTGAIRSPPGEREVRNGGDVRMSTKDPPLPARTGR